MVDFEKKPEGDDRPEFGPLFDHDSTSQSAIDPVFPNPTESYPLPGYPAEPQQTQAYPTAFGSEYPYPTAPVDPANTGGQFPGGQYPATQNPQAQYPPAAYPAQPYSQPPHFVQPHYSQPQYGQQLYPQQQNPYGGYQQPGYGAAPAYFVNSGADAPFGRDPITGEPLSDKSKIVGGLLQIFLGGFGAGRFYIGSNGIAVAQLLLLVLGWLTVILGIGVLILMGLGIWVLVDGILMLVGNVKDSSGRRLRN